MLERRDDYASLYRDFRWIIPERFNIGVAVADRWAAEDPDRTALFDYRADGTPDRLSFSELARRSNALGQRLAGTGHKPRRPSCASPAAELRNGHRASRYLQARRHRLAAGAAFRRRGAGVPPADRRREAGRHQCGGRGQAVARSQDACPVSTGSCRCRRRMVARSISSGWWPVTPRILWPKTPVLTTRR